MDEFGIPIVIDVESVAKSELIQSKYSCVKCRFTQGKQNDENTISVASNVVTVAQISAPVGSNAIPVVVKPPPVAK